MQSWLRPYLHPNIMDACKILAEHVDYLEEEAFRLSDGRWRPRKLTLFIEAGCMADRSKEAQLKQIVREYMELVESKKESRLSEALITLKRWFSKR